MKETIENTKKKREEFEHLKRIHAYEIKGKCSICGKEEETELHHILPLGAGGTNVSGNIVEVCCECHSKIHNYTDRKELQKIGIQKKLEEGGYGRPEIQLPENFDEVITRWKTGEITAVKAMELTGLKKTTFYKIIKERGIKKVS